MALGGHASPPSALRVFETDPGRARKCFSRARSPGQTNGMRFSATEGIVTAALSISTVACARLTGLDDYTKSQCGGDCRGAGAADDAGSQTGVDASQGPERDRPSLPESNTAEGPGTDGPRASLPDAGESSSPREGDAEGATDLTCAAGCTESVTSGYACPRGGCNSAQGGCVSSDERCYCASDAQCLGGLCVRQAGENDRSCGSACTGSGPHDGFNCTLSSAGIPQIAPTGFGYAPSNFVPSRSGVPDSATVIDCSASYDAGTHTFTSWCGGRIPPSITPNVTQTGGPPVDILSFRQLTILPGATLSLSSEGNGNAVILAVYGDATVQGGIHADGNNGLSGTSDPGVSGPGGNSNCGKSAGQDRGRDGHCSGGAGAGASAAGGTGPGGVGGVEIAGGVARPNALLQPLYGGCPGGTSGSWACITSGGGGGGAVQISAAGSIVITGSVTANGGNGGTATCQANGCTVYGGGGGGGGSGGALLLEGEMVTVTGGIVSVNGGRGGGSFGGGLGGDGGTASAPAGQTGTGHALDTCGAASECGGGGGGAYGYLVIRSRNPGVCATKLMPAPAVSLSATSCLCVADSNCPGGRCVNEASRCTDTCSGVGTADFVGCQLVVPVPSSWSCPVGNCRSVRSPDEACTAEGVPCWCTRDADCPGGKCADWAGCAAGACSAIGPADGFHCVY